MIKNKMKISESLNLKITCFILLKRFKVLFIVVSRSAYTILSYLNLNKPEYKWPLTDNRQKKS